LAVSMATAVSTPRPPAPNHTPRPAITSAEPPSSMVIAAVAQSHAGCSPKCACSATAPGKSRHVETGRLVRVLEAWCAQIPGFFLYYPSHRHTPVTLRAFIDFLKPDLPGDGTP
jgi:DNA-binding transcriptional LysR family regulator